MLLKLPGLWGTKLFLLFFSFRSLLQDGISDLFCVFLSLESIEKCAKDYYMGVGMMILVISVAFALAALRLSALRSPPVVPELIMVEFIPKRNEKIRSFFLTITLSMLPSGLSQVQKKGELLELNRWVGNSGNMNMVLCLVSNGNRHWTDEQSKNTPVV